MFLLRPIINLTESIQNLTRAIVVLIEDVRKLVIEIRDLRKVIQLRKPGLVFSKMISEGMNGMSKFALVLPTPGAPDVANGGSRELVYSVNDGPVVNSNLPGTAMESESFDAEEEQVVSGTLVDIDNAGNRSDPRPFSVILKDNLAPPQPGEVGARMIEETESPEPTPAPNP